MMVHSQLYASCFEIGAAPKADAEVTSYVDIGGDEECDKVSVMSVSQCSSIVTKDSRKASSQSTPKSFGTGSSAKQSKRMFMCRVTLLDGSTFEPPGIDKNASGQNVFDAVIKHLDIIEIDYFGLTYRDKNSKKYWLDHTKKVSKQVSVAAWVFEFQVKFYPPDPMLLKEDITRYQLCLQLRVDIFNGRLPCSFSTYALLGSYTVQAELGNWDPEVNGDGLQYLNDFDFAPTQNQELLEKIQELHKFNKGQTPSVAEKHFLENAKKLALYGVDMHEVKDSENKDLSLGVCATGILVYKDRLRINRYVWPKILKLSYKRDMFDIKLRPDELDRNGTTISYMAPDHKLAKRLWKTCVEHHAFFRLKTGDPPANDTLFPRFNTRFRYSGRTALQARKAVEMVDRKEPHIQRTAERRTINKNGGLGDDAKKFLPQALDAPDKLDNKNAEELKKEEFMQLLKETPEITGTSHLSDVKSKIKDDPRYKAVESNDKRNEWFQEYVDNKLKEDFLKLLQETPTIISKSTWHDARHIIDHDPRFKAVPNDKQREVWFDEYIQGLMKSEFRQLLQDTPTIISKSGWVDVKSDIDQDPRYLAVDSDDKRKNWFDEYIQDMKKEEFMQLLKETPDITLNSLYLDVRKKICQEPRFLNVDTEEQREQYFNEYLENMRKATFTQLLRDTPDITATSKWHESKQLLETDPRYHAVDNDFNRACCFNAYVNSLPRGKKSKKEKEEEKKKKKEEEKRKIEEAKEKKRLEKEKQDKLKEAPIDAKHDPGLLESPKEKDKDKKHAGSIFSKFGRGSQKDAKGKDKKPSEADEQMEKHVPHIEIEEATASESENIDPDSQDSERDYQSKYVSDDKQPTSGADHSKLFGISEEDSLYLKDQLKEDFLQLLRVTPAITSTSKLADMKSMIKDDTRYKAVDSDARRNEWFKEYVDHLLKEDFMRLLRETPAITSQSTWSDAQKEIDHDPRFIAVVKESQRKDWFDEYIQSLLKSEFKQLLKDTPTIHSQSRWEGVTGDIDRDPRYLAVNSPEKRQEWFNEYIQELKKEEFMALLQETHAITPYSKYTDVREDISGDLRFHNVDTEEQREQYFNEYVQNLKKADFMKLLQDTPDITATSKWHESKHLIETDPRYHAVDSDLNRARWFNEYVNASAGYAYGDANFSWRIGGYKSIDRKLEFLPITQPLVATRGDRMPFFEPIGDSDIDAFGKKRTPPPVAKKPPVGQGFDSEEDRLLHSKTGEPITVKTESFKYNPDINDVRRSTSNIPIVETKTHKVIYERDGIPVEMEDITLISSHSVTTKTQTIDTTTYKTERDGVVETLVERKVTITSEEDDDLDHDALLRAAIEEVTHMNPDITVEKIECMRQIEDGIGHN